MAYLIHFHEGLYICSLINTQNPHQAYKLKYQSGQEEVMLGGNERDCASVGQSGRGYAQIWS